MLAPLLAQELSSETSTNIFSHVGMSSTSFFSAQLSQDTVVLHGTTIPFDFVQANYGGDYLQSGAVYLYVNINMATSI